MTEAERHARLKEPFFAALDRHGEERAAILARARAEDPDLAVELEAMVRRHEGDSEELFASLGREAAADLAPTDLTGRRLGAYRLVRPIAEGGMARV